MCIRDSAGGGDLSELRGKIAGSFGDAKPHEENVFRDLIDNWKETSGSGAVDGGTAAPGGVEMTDAAPRGRAGGVWEPTPFHPNTVDVDVSDISFGVLENMDTLTIYNAPPNFDPQAIHAEMLRAQSMGTLERWSVSYTHLTLPTNREV